MTYVVPLSILLDRQFGAAQCFDTGGNEMVLFRLVNNPEEIGSLGRLGLLEVAMQFDMAPGRGRVLEQGNMVSNWLYVEYECVCIVKYLEVLMCAY